MLQYSHYKGTIVPTPQQSSPALVNEHHNQPQGQGQGAVPIGEPVKLEEVVKEPDTTTIGFGQAEPGRDIFAGHPHNDLKSKEGEAPRKAEDAPDSDQELKEISSQSVDSATEGSKVAEAETQIDEGSASSYETASTAESSSVDGASSASSEPEQTPAHAHEHVEGPKGEEEAEADRVREDLFPDAQVE